MCFTHLEWSAYNHQKPLWCLFKATVKIIIWITSTPGNHLKQGQGWKQEPPPTGPGARGLSLLELASTSLAQIVSPARLGPGRGLGPREATSRCEASALSPGGWCTTVKISASVNDTGTPMTVAVSVKFSSCQSPNYRKCQILSPNHENILRNVLEVTINSSI